MLDIDVGKIVVEPFEFENIIKINIEKELNEHSKMYVYGVIKDDKQVTPVIDATEGIKIKCVHDEKVYFSGVLQNIKITCVEEVYHLEVYAISNTILLDTVKHKRSFQDNAQTYQDIVETVIKDAGASVTYNASAMTVENIILQYNETDWEFAKRLASHTNDVLIPITDDMPKFHFGATDDGDAKVETNGYSISKNFDAFRRMSKEEKPLTADDVTIYAIKMNEFIGDLGEKINLNGDPLHICRLSLFLENSALTVIYTLTAKKAISTPKFYNPAITGLILDGTVTEVENDTLKLKLDDDQKRGVELDTAEAHFFKYATDYSMENHTGWYVMPEEGDTVQLLFPNEDEKYAYATSAIRQEDTDKTTDHLVKFWRTSFGKEIKMDEKEILITAKDGSTFIQINEESGIVIKTPNPILISSGSTLTMTSEDDMTIKTEKNLHIEAKDNIKMVCGGNNMEFYELGGQGISMETDKEYKLSSDDNATVDGKKEISVKSGKDMKLDSGTKLVESAQTQIDVLAAGSSVVLKSSGVDIKGALVKEN
jgi:hypothetical protein